MLGNSRAVRLVPELGPTTNHSDRQREHRDFPNDPRSLASTQRAHILLLLRGAREESHDAGCGNRSLRPQGLVEPCPPKTSSLLKVGTAPPRRLRFHIEIEPELC